MDASQRTGARPGWDEYFMNIALVVATRATCQRRHVGSVLVRDKRVIATGYNGSVYAEAHCEDVGCLLENGHCVRCVHAEINALLQCAAFGIPAAGSTLYTTDFPCAGCSKALVQVGVKKVVYLAEYPDDRSQEILRMAGVEVYRAFFSDRGFCLVREV